MHATYAKLLGFDICLPVLCDRFTSLENRSFCDIDSVDCFFTLPHNYRNNGDGFSVFTELGFECSSEEMF